jgi:hypothetical protein
MSLLFRLSGLTSVLRAQKHPVFLELKRDSQFASLTLPLSQKNSRFFFGHTC